MSIKTLISSREFAATGSETDDCELIRGEIVRMPPPKPKHGAICNRLAYLLTGYVERLGKGIVLSNDTGIITETDPDTVRGVDVLVYLHPSWGEELPDHTISEAPDLAAEVRSAEQSWKKMLEKVLEYLSMGARLVWVIDPSVKRIHIFRPDQEPQVLAEGTDLDGGDVLPGFSCPVAAIFKTR